MERLTRADLERMAQTLNRELNRPTEMFESKGSTRMNVGHLFIEKTPNGRYRLIEINNPTGGENTPFGSNSYTVSEMYACLRAAREIITFDKLKRFPKADTTVTNSRTNEQENTK